MDATGSLLCIFSLFLSYEGGSVMPMVLVVLWCKGRGVRGGWRGGTVAIFSLYSIIKGSFYFLGVYYYIPGCVYYGIVYSVW